MRTPMQRSAPRAQMLSFPAPRSGWIANQNLALNGVADGAWKLTNFFPTANGAELRGGSALYATLGEDTPGYVLSFMRYKNGALEKFFGATETDIYDISSDGDPEEPLEPIVSGLTNGRWNSTQFAATGGVYLIAANGFDSVRVFDSNVFFPATADELSQLNFDTKVSDFSIGAVLTGGTSGATAEIVAVHDAGTTGYLLIKGISSGPFQDDETITDGEGGEAIANGADVVVFLGIDGVATNRLSFVWAYKNRLFFIERDTMNVWYADIDGIGGTLTVFPMGGVFPLGGSLIFGAAWSLDTSGQGGLSEQCVFVTTEGEIAVYQGGNPGDANDWNKVGLYRIGKPLGPKAWFRSGGDIVILTDIGAIPLSRALTRDYAALPSGAISYPIEDAWNQAVAARRAFPWSCAIWPDQQMVVIALPTLPNEQPAMFVANATTGAWCDFSNWDGACVEIFQGRLFFGSSNGRVIEAYRTGADRGDAYTGIYVPTFTDAGQPAGIKSTIMAHPVVLTVYDVIFDVTMQFDYEVQDLVAPPAAPVNAESIWGEAVWGEAVWGSLAKKRHQQEWLVTGGIGYTFAPALQISSGSTAPNDVQIVRIDVTFQAAEIVT